MNLGSSTKEQNPICSDFSLAISECWCAISSEVVDHYRDRHKILDQYFLDEMNSPKS